MTGKGSGIYMWAGAGAIGGDMFITADKKFGDIPVGAIGFDSDGATTGAVYHWNGQSWIATGQTVAGFYGV